MHVSGNKKGDPKVANASPLQGREVRRRPVLFEEVGRHLGTGFRAFP